MAYLYLGSIPLTTCKNITQKLGKKLIKKVVDMIRSLDLVFFDPKLLQKVRQYVLHILEPPAFTHLGKPFDCILSLVTSMLHCITRFCMEKYYTPWAAGL